MMQKKCIGMKILLDEKAQAMTEYVMVFAILALAIAGLFGMWRLSLARYFNALAQALVKTR